MTQEDRLSMSMACCTTCLLADAMKDCINCAFYPSLAFKALAQIKAGQAGDYPPELLQQTKQDFIEAIKAKSNHGLSVS